MSTFEAGKEYRTRNGKPARIYCLDGCRHKPIHGAINYADGWSVEQWCADGRYQHDSSADGNLDLMPPKHSWWINVFPGGFCTTWSTQKLAEFNSVYINDYRLACVYVTEGDGL